jgi:hypothetical protein
MMDYAEIDAGDKGPNRNLRASLCRASTGSEWRQFFPAACAVVGFIQTVHLSQRGQRNRDRELRRMITYGQLKFLFPL